MNEFDDVQLLHTMKPEEVLGELDRVCKGFGRKLPNGDRVLFRIGQLAVEVGNRELFKPRFPSLTQFVIKEIIKKHKISNGSIWQVITFCRIPGLKPSMAVNLSLQRQVVIARRWKNVAMTPREIEKLLTDAATMSDDNFELKYPPIGSGLKKTIAVEASIHRVWTKWLGKRDSSKVLHWLVIQHPSGPPSSEK
jgi:hypothetical protein